MGIRARPEVVNIRDVGTDWDWRKGRKWVKRWIWEV